MLNGKVEILVNDQGNRITPSYVAFTDEERLVGDAAKNQYAAVSVLRFHDSSSGPCPGPRDASTDLAGIAILIKLQSRTQLGPFSILSKRNHACVHKISG